MAVDSVIAVALQVETIPPIAFMVSCLLPLSEVICIVVVFCEGVDEDVLNIIDALTMTLQVTDADVVLVALFTVVGSDVAVEGVAHVGGRCGQVEAMFGQLLTVEADVQLRPITKIGVLNIFLNLG